MDRSKLFPSCLLLVRWDERSRVASKFCNFVIDDPRAGVFHVELCLFLFWPWFLFGRPLGLDKTQRERA